jgi:hypothetical protein
MIKENPKMNICTWIYCDSNQEESLYPQVGGNSSSLRFQEIYWKCVVVFFATSIRNNPDQNHILFTNTKSVQPMERFDLIGFLTELGVSIIHLPLTYRTPDGYYGSWKNQFFIFDILNYIQPLAEENEQYIILDSDCIWIRPATQISQAIQQAGLLTMVADIENSPNYTMNGISRLNMKEIYNELGVSTKDEAPHYYGGEMFAAKGSEIKLVVDEINEVWSKSMSRFEKGKLKFNEEAHMLSYIYFKLGYSHKSGNKYIKRIWTQLFGSNNVDGTEKFLTIWHMPTEKKLGIKRLFIHVINKKSLFWKIPVGDAFISYLQRSVGLPRRNLSKLIADIYDSLISKIARKLLK